jgi:hypothetical protein
MDRRRISVDVASPPMDFRVTLVRADGTEIDGAWLYSAPQLPAVDDQSATEIP